MDSCRGKDNWTNRQKLCQCLIGRKGKRYRRRNPLIALSLKDRGGAGSVIADGLKVSQNTTVEMDFRGGCRQEACNDAGCRQICGRMRRNRILRQSRRVHWYISSLCREQRTRRFYFSVFTFHVMTSLFQVIPLGP